MIHLDIIDGCNFKCYFCPAKDVPQIKMMDVELFKRLILEAKDLGIRTIHMVPEKGEPFLHPNIYEMLEFASTNMKEVIVISNGTAINAGRLKDIDIPNVNLGISYYGDTIEKFTEMTGVGHSLFAIVHKRIDELRAANIEFTVYRRDDPDYQLHDLDETAAKFDPSTKCQYHFTPKICYNGDVTFCNFPVSPEMAYCNVNTTSLREALEHPLRYKFYDSQSICAARCTSWSSNCWTKQTMTTFKLMNASKQQYIMLKEVTDRQYEALEHELIQ